MATDYQSTWDSLSRHPIPRWFCDAKFGIYTHWGPYSVPAFGPNGSWYPTRMYKHGKDTPAYRHHVNTYGPLSSFGYRKFIPMFKGERFDADEWAELFKKSGAAFAGPVAEHHDGFSMWDSKVNPWNAAKMGPKRDIVAALEKAVRGQGMKYITTFHHAFNWWFFPTWDKATDCSNPKFSGLYTRPHKENERPDKAFLDLWRAKLDEVVEAVEPDMVWFDFCIGKIQESYRRDFLASYYNKERVWKKDVIVVYKEHDLPPGTGLHDLELGKMHEMAYHRWLTDTTVDAIGAWSFVSDAGYKPVERLVHDLVDRVSKNGAMLLNVGPRADGSIPEPARECLLGIGQWLGVNGEAIYGTTPWLTCGEGPTQTTEKGGVNFNEKNELRYTASDIRFTTKGNALYAICLGRPGEVLTIKTLASRYPSEIRSVRMLGVNRDLKWRLDADRGLQVECPERMPCEHAFTFKIE